MALVELYLIRHGVAADRGDAYPDDSKRPLTSAGLARLRKEAKALADLGVGFDVIVASPLVRTKQTAEIFAQTSAPAPQVILSDALAPAGSAASVFQELARHARKGRIALVGHEPNLGELAARMIGARVPLAFKKGAVCRIDFDVLPPKGTGQLRWFVTPRMLRRIR
ncbi:MAG TPA: phosphohistidine phosphatase SixA [Vicinamibacterales bacterium]|nr:phosphohistidine phosphatase SixA [Vicinamibacterales bacterium]